MRLDARLNRGTLIVLAAATLAASFATPAAADRGRRWKGVFGGGDCGPRVQRVVVAGPRFAYVSRSSCGTPGLASFIGGLVIGSAIAHAAPPAPVYCAPAPVYCAPAPIPADYYFDPYCHRSFASLDDYGDHLDRCDHPSWVEVRDGRSGRRIGECYWQDGRWHERSNRDDDDDQGGDWNH